MEYQVTIIKLIHTKKEIHITKETDFRFKMHRVNHKRFPEHCCKRRKPSTARLKRINLIL